MPQEHATDHTSDDEVSSHNVPLVDPGDEDQTQLGEEPITNDTHYSRQFGSTLVRVGASTRYDHRDDLPQNIRMRLQQSRGSVRTESHEHQIRKVAPNPETEAGKRSVLVLSCDISSSAESCSPTRILNMC